MNENKAPLPPIFWNDAHQNAPAFIKGKVSIKARELFEYVKANAEFINKGWMSFTMKESKNGKIYFELDTYKPTPKQQPYGTLYPQDDNGAVSAIQKGTHPVPTIDDHFPEFQPIDDSQIPF